VAQAAFRLTGSMIKSLAKEKQQKQQEGKGGGDKEPPSGGAGGRKLLASGGEAALDGYVLRSAPTAGNLNGAGYYLGTPAWNDGGWEARLEASIRFSFATGHGPNHHFILCGPVGAPSEGADRYDGNRTFRKVNYCAGLPIIDQCAGFGGIEQAIPWVVYWIRHTLPAG
jgi:hypothetical protein